MHKATADTMEETVRRPGAILNEAATAQSAGLSWGPDKWYSNDSQFNQLYPPSIQLLAARHWTPVNIARKASVFLAAEKGVKILDIGSGVGKFCIAAAHFMPDALYFGVEQRKDLIIHAEAAKEITGLLNVSFLHANFTKLDLTQFDHFYFYNAFYENLRGTDKIDDSIDYSVALYHYYNHYLYKQLEKMPPGTRLATFHSLEAEIPPGFYTVRTEMNSLLKFWIKE